MPDTSRANLGERVGLALERDLVKFCCIAKDGVKLSMETLELQLSHEDANSLLELLLRGAGSSTRLPGSPPSDTPSAAHRQPSEPPSPEDVSASPLGGSSQDIAVGHSDVDPSDAYHKKEVFRATPTTPARERMQLRPSSAPEPPVMGGDGGSYPEENVSDEYLDSVLSFALSMNIIEGYTKNREARMVTLRMGATTTGLSYWETLEYLTNSMLFELRPKGED